MKITSAAFTTSEVSLDRFPTEGLFEIVLVGKSNVGKSSFINAMLNRKGLARTSSQPGKTRTANLYLINDQFYFIDMPGYGYAEVSKSMKAEFNRILKNYLMKRETDFVVFFLIDYRHEPTKNDIEMFQNIISCDIFPIFILTKSDKVKNSQKAIHLKKIKEAFELEDDDALFTFSVDNPSEIQKVWAFIAGLLNPDNDE